MRHHQLLRKNLQIIFFLFIALLASDVRADQRLVFVVDLVRHGERTPMQEFPSAPHIWKEGLGNLTPRGNSQLLQLGQEFRKKYIDEYKLLPQNYDAQTMYIRSTDTARTKASAQMLLLGLYPLEARRIQKSDSIYIHTVPKKEDKILVVHPSKSLLAKIKLYLYSHFQWWQKTKHLKSEIKRWEKATGLTIGTFEEFNLLADTLHAREQNNIMFPAGISTQDAKIIFAVDDWIIENYFNQKEITEPTGKQFLQTLSKNIQHALKQNQPLKYILYLGHDSSIMSIMNTLGIPVNEVPDYVANLNFSVFENEGQYYLQVNYNSKAIEIPYCKAQLCTLKQFREMVG